MPWNEDYGKRVASVRLRHRGTVELLSLSLEVVGTYEVDWEIELAADTDGSPYELSAIAYDAGVPGDWGAPPRSAFQRLADRCRHARLGFLDGRPGTLEDVEERLDELDRCVRWWQALAQKLIRERP